MKLKARLVFREDTCIKKFEMMNFNELMGCSKNKIGHMIIEVWLPTKGKF